MRKHIGRKAAAVGLATAAVCGAAGTALAASGSGSHAAAAPTGGSAGSAITASAASSTQSSWPLVKTTMPAIAKRLYRSEKQMISALDDMKNDVIGNPKVNRSNLKAVEVKILATELEIPIAEAAWVVDEIEGGYVWTNVNWGFGK